MIVRSGTGFIIATHNQDIAAAMSARTVCLKSGKIVDTQVSVLQNDAAHQVKSTQFGDETRRVLT